MVSEIEGTRLVELAQALIQNVARQIYGRSVDLRLLASDAEIVAATMDPSPENLLAAQGRLQQLVETSPYYVNAFFADAQGKVLLCSNPHARVLRVDLNDAAQYRSAMASRRRDEWFTDEVWENPYSDGRAVLVFVTGIRPRDSDGAPSGVFYLEFDWQGHIPAIISDKSLFGEKDWARTRISIVDPAARVVADTQGTRYGEIVPLPAKAVRGTESRGDSIVAFATASEYHGFAGLGLRCVIEQKMLSTEEIDAELGGLRARLPTG
jgi:hypothetical protein